MRKIFLSALFLLPLVTFSQRLHLNLFGGFTNYQGDIQEKVFTLDQSNGAFGAGLKYDLTNHFSLRGGFMYGKASADDKQNKPSLQLRNLNFQTKILEGNLMVEYTLFDLYERRLSPYAFAGVALYHFNPYTYDTLGQKYFLKPLSTEGQGLEDYPDRDHYRLTQFALPLGGGLKYRLSDNVVIAYEIGLRKLMTDYFDDVSKTYVAPDVLMAARGPVAVELAYRGDELKTGNPIYPAGGTMRGSEKQKDWYYFQGIQLSIGLGSGNGVFGSGKGRISCPGKVL